MANQYYNLVRVSSPTTGNATTLLVGDAVPGFLNFAQAEVQNGDKLTYGIIDGFNRELCKGVYSAVDGTLTRETIVSTNNGAPIVLSGKAQIYITVVSDDLQNLNLSVISVDTVAELQNIDPDILFNGKQISVKNVGMFYYQDGEFIPQAMNISRGSEFPANPVENQMFILNPDELYFYDGSRWRLVSGEVDEAPGDGVVYGRQYGGWASVNEIIDEAEADAIQQSQEYTDQQISSLSEVYDPIGSAEAAEQNAKDYTDTEIGKLSEVYDPIGSADTVEQNLRDYVDGIVQDGLGSAAYEDVEAFDPAGSASTAEQNANQYTDDRFATLGTAAFSDSEDFDAAGSSDTALADAKEYTDVKFNELGTAAYEDVEAFDPAGSADAVEQTLRQYIDDTVGDVVGDVDLSQLGTAAFKDELDFDPAGAASTAEDSSKQYTDDEIAKLSEVYDPLGSADTAEQNAKDYTDQAMNDLGLANLGTAAYRNESFFDEAGAAATAEQRAKTYTDESEQRIIEYIDNQFTELDLDNIGTAAYQDVEDFDAAGSAATAEQNAKTHADGLHQTAMNRAASAEQNAKDYTDQQLEDINIAGLGTAAYQDIEAFDAAGSATTALNDAKAYTDQQLDNIEIGGLGTAAYENVEAFDSAGSALTAEQNAKDYTDQRLDDINIGTLGSAAYAEIADFDPAGSAATALDDAKDYTDQRLDDINIGTLGSAAYAEIADFDPAGSAATALDDAKAYTDQQLDSIEIGGLGSAAYANVEDFDPAGSAATAEQNATDAALAAEQNAKDYTDQRLDDINIGTLGSAAYAEISDFDPAGSAATAQANAYSYADDAEINAKNYTDQRLNDINIGTLGSAAYEDVEAFDPAGSAATAEQNSKTYTDEQILQLDADGIGLIPDAVGELTDALVFTTETNGVPYIFLVSEGKDVRTDKNIPAALSGDHSRHMIRYDGTNWISYGPFLGTQGEKGDTGAGTPAGGNPNQVLIKQSDNDYDTKWSSTLLSTFVGGSTGEITLSNSTSNITFWMPDYQGYRIRVNDTVTRFNPTFAKRSSFPGDNTFAFALYLDMRTEPIVNWTFSGVDVIWDGGSPPILVEGRHMIIFVGTGDNSGAVGKLVWSS